MASARYIVNDVDKSVVFYRDRLNFRVDMHNPGKFAALERDDLTLYLSAPGAGSGGTAGGHPEPGGWNRFMIVTQDINSLIRAAERCWRQIQGRIQRGRRRAREAFGRSIRQSHRAV